MIEAIETQPAPRRLSSVEEMDAALRAAFASLSHRAAWKLHDYLRDDLSVMGPVDLENELRRLGVPLGKSRPK